MADTKFEEDTVGYGTEITNLELGIKGWGTMSGLAVSEKGAGADMSVDIAAGIAVINATVITKGSTTNVAITAAHATLDRIDIIVLDSGGTISVQDGTAASTPLPTTIPANSIMLARLLVQATTSTIVDNDITDERIVVSISADIINSGTYLGIPKRDESGDVEYSATETAENADEVSTQSDTYVDTGKDIVVDLTNVDFIYVSYEMRCSTNAQNIGVRLERSGVYYSTSLALTPDSYAWRNGSAVDVRGLTGSITFNVQLQEPGSFTAYNRGLHIHFNAYEEVDG